MSVGHR